MTLLTAAERRFGWFMLGSGVVYLVVGLFFWVLPQTTQLLSALPARAVGLEDGAALPASLWMALGVSMMATIGTCSLLAGIDPRRHRPFAVPVIVSKATSTLVATSLLLSGQAQGSVLGVVVTDLPIFLVTLWLFVAARRSVNGSWLRGGPPLG